MWQGLLEALGAVLSFFYDLIPNYGVAIILLTLAVRVVLLPLTIKQTRSMQAMQKIQPQLKALQQKHKGDRQKLNEEVMKLYKEHQVNPLGGCLPLILQLPVFIALYSVLRGDPAKAAALPGGAGQMHNPAIAHLPEGSNLAQAIDTQQAGFLGMNLGCSPLQAGKGVVEIPGGGSISCGDGFGVAIPFFVLVALMVFTTYYQQKQMQASGGQQAAQQQMIMRIMPVFLGVISLQIPAGVLLYWVTTNLWQVGQQGVMLQMRVREQAAAPPPEKPAAPAARTEPPKSSGRKGRNAGSRKKRRKR